MSSVTTEERVRERAYELFVERGGNHGNDQDDWFRAKTELGSNKGKGGSSTKTRGKNTGRKRG